MDEKKKKILKEILREKLGPSDFCIPIILLMKYAKQKGLVTAEELKLSAEINKETGIKNPWEDIPSEGLSENLMKSIEQHLEVCEDCSKKLQILSASTEELIDEAEDPQTKGVEMPPEKKDKMLQFLLAEIRKNK